MAESVGRIAREQGTQAPIFTQRVDPSTRADAPQSTRAVPGSGDAEKAAAANRISQAEKRVLAELRARDREVRAHETAHQTVAGRYAGAIQFEYQRGPDGRMYATGGSVQVDTAPVAGDPEATIQKMETIRAAALAPGNPSAQDQAVAAQAQREIVQARVELAAENSEQDDELDAPASTATAAATAGSSEVAQAEAGLPSLTSVPPNQQSGPARDAALAFREIEQYGNSPAALPTDARPGISLFV